MELFEAAHGRLLQETRPISLLLLINALWSRFLLFTSRCSGKGPQKREQGIRRLLA